MNAVSEEVIPAQKNLADLQEEYRRLDHAVETEIRSLREERPAPISKLDELIAKLHVLFEKHSRRR